MSYLAIDQLTIDPVFTARIRSCVTEQSIVFKDDGRPDIAAVAVTCLRGADSAPFVAFNRLLGAAPGFAENADMGNGTIEQAQIGDAEILAAVQADYPVVADLFFNDDGTPITP